MWLVLGLVFLGGVFSQSHRTLDGVMVTAAGPNDLIFPLSVRSVLKHHMDVDRLFIISPHPNVLAGKYKNSFGPRVTWVDERTLPIVAENVTKSMILTAKKKKRPRYPITGESLLEKFLAGGKTGWYLQQILKFYAGEFLDLQDWVVLDSDLVWHRDVHFRVHPRVRNATATSTAAAVTGRRTMEGVEGGAQAAEALPKYLYAYGTQYHLQYYATMKVLLDIWPADKKRKHYSGIVHHMVFVKEVVEDMKAHIEAKHGKKPSVLSLMLLSRRPRAPGLSRMQLTPAVTLRPHPPSPSTFQASPCGRPWETCRHWS